MKEKIKARLLQLACLIVSILGSYPIWYFKPEELVPGYAALGCGLLVLAGIVALSHLIVSLIAGKRFVNACENASPIDMIFCLEEY